MKENTNRSQNEIPADVRSKLPREVQEYLRSLEDELKKKGDELKNKENELKEKEKEVENLKDLLRISEGRLKQDSTNSSKPPSSDGLNKKPTIPGSQRRKSGKKPGAQRGHPGTRLKAVPKPNLVIHHPLQQCACGFELSNIEVDKTRSSQV